MDVHADEDFDQFIRERFLLTLLVLLCLVAAHTYVHDFRSAETLIAELLLVVSLGASLFSLAATPLVLTVSSIASLESFVHQIRVVHVLNLFSSNACALSLAVLLPFAFLYEQAPARNFIGRVAATILELVLVQLLALLSGLVIVQLAPFWFKTSFEQSIFSALVLPGMLTHIVSFV